MTSIVDIFGPVTAIVNKVFDKLFPDPTEKEKAKLAMAELQAQGLLKELEAELQFALAQAEINKIEASSDSLFKSGWRPYVGWVCGGALTYQYLFRPIASWVALLSGSETILPALELETLISLLFAMLGMGGFRTFEKVKRLK